MFYRIKDNELLDYADYKYSDKCLEYKDITMEEYNNDKDLLVIDNDMLIANPDYNKVKADKRKDEFNRNFFCIDTDKYYRTIPKGYSNVPDSLNTACNIVNILGYLPKDILIYYKAPDFYNPEQCTEEWLVNNSYKNTELTKEDFVKLYTDIITKYNNEVHNG